MKKKNVYKLIIYIIFCFLYFKMNYQYLFDILEKKRKTNEFFILLITNKLNYIQNSSGPNWLNLFVNQLITTPNLIQLQQKQNNFILSGTILTLDDIDYCMSLGVKIFFSPHFDSQLFHYCCLKKCILIPGVYTPTEVMEAYRNGARILKFFPSNSESSLTILQQFNHLFSRLEHIQFIASGGINESNYERILSFEYVSMVSRLK